MAHPEDGYRPGDVCRHHAADVQQDSDRLRWICTVCTHEWLSIPEPGFWAQVSKFFEAMYPR